MAALLLQSVDAAELSGSCNHFRFMKRLTRDERAVDEMGGRRVRQDGGFAPSKPLKILCALLETAAPGQHFVAS